jgi:peptidyl-tRNA hydrolase
MGFPPIPGSTQVEPGSKTVMSIGPALKTVFDSLTGHLKLL